jgi:hypothetical protein
MDSVRGRGRNAGNGEGNGSELRDNDEILVCDSEVLNGLSYWHCWNGINKLAGQVQSVRIGKERRRFPYLNGNGFGMAKRPLVPCKLTSKLLPVFPESVESDGKTNTEPRASCCCCSPSTPAPVCENMLISFPTSPEFYRLFHPICASEG